LLTRLWHDILVQQLDGAFETSEFHHGVLKTRVGKCSTNNVKLPESGASRAVGDPCKNQSTPRSCRWTERILEELVEHRKKFGYAPKQLNYQNLNPKQYLSCFHGRQQNVSKEFGGRRRSQIQWSAPSVRQFLKLSLFTLCIIAYLSQHVSIDDLEHLVKAEFAQTLHRIAN
jgi:hypothetical protein